jgi:hypothetical protein
MRKPVQGVILFGAIIAVGSVFFLFNPVTARFYPKCMFHEMTGLYCPGCGSTRALHCLLHGELREALHDNALAVIALPLVGVMVLRRSLRRRPPVQTSSFRPIWIVAFLAVIVAFGVLRNVPCRPFSWLAPPSEGVSSPK